MSQSGRSIPHLIRVSELRELMTDATVRVVDVRWRLGDPEAGARMYAEGHIPGAVFADVDKDLASEPGAGGRHPLPSPEAFVQAMSRLGVQDDTRVIAYDDMGGATAARLWFLLRYFGHETGAVLDGGLSAYTAAGGALERDSPQGRGGAERSLGERVFHARVRPELVVDRAELIASSVRGDTVLLDARAPERYRGDVEPIDPRAGHIPTAVNAPFAGNLEGGRFLGAEALRARYAELGATEKETAVYCGSGVTACHDLLALALVGVEGAKLYAGSWSEWARDPQAEVVVGGAPEARSELAAAVATK